MGKARRDLPVIAFKSQQAWDAWLTSQPAGSKGLWLKLAKKSSGIASVSKPDAIDTALEFYARPDAWRQLQRNGMTRDFSWRGPAARYRKLYEELAPEAA